jgi:hypothetical protein
MRSRCAWLLAAVALLSVSPLTRANYVLDLYSSSGGSDIYVQPGDSFGVNVYLTSNASDQSDVASFDILFSGSGLTYTSYSWQSPYGGTDDASVPLASDLPLTITASTYTKGASGAVDVHLDNYLDSGAFTEGLLAQLTLTVPSSWTGAGIIDITPSPDTFNNAVGPPLPIPTTAGSGVDVHVTATPEPATTVLAFAALAAGAAVRKRKKSRA